MSVAVRFSLKNFGERETFAGKWRTTKISDCVVCHWAFGFRLFFCFVQLCAKPWPLNGTSCFHSINMWMVHWTIKWCRIQPRKHQIYFRFLIPFNHPLLYFYRNYYHPSGTISFMKFWICCYSIPVCFIFDRSIKFLGDFSEH